MKLPFIETVDIGMKAKWDSKDYADMVIEVTEWFSVNVKPLTEQEKLQLNVIVGAAFRAGYLAAEDKLNPQIHALKDQVLELDQRMKDIEFRLTDT
jgi:hypothetical protein